MRISRMAANIVVVPGPNGRVRLTSDLRDGCTGCAQSLACSGQPFTVKPVMFPSLVASIGPVGQVTVSVSTARLLRAVVVSYLVPAVLLILGAALGNIVAPGDDFPALLGAASGLMLGAVIIRRYDSRSIDIGLQRQSLGRPGQALICKT